MVAPAVIAKKKATLRETTRAIKAHPRNLKRRDELIRDLYEAGVSRDDLAKLSGLTPGRISQIGGQPNGNS